MARAPRRTRALGVEIARLKGELASLEARRESERARLEKLRVEIAGLSARLDFDLPRLADTAQEKRAQVRDLALDKDALKEAIDTLDACIKDFQENDVFRLSEEMSQLFSRITDGKYTRVHLGPSLEPLVATGDRAGIRPEDSRPALRTSSTSRCASRWCGTCRATSGCRCSSTTRS